MRAHLRAPRGGLTNFPEMPVPMLTISVVSALGGRIRTPGRPCDSVMRASACSFLLLLLVVRQPWPYSPPNIFSKVRRGTRHRRPMRMAVNSPFFTAS